MSNDRTMEELVKDLKLAIFSEMTNKCKCKHDDSCKLNSYLWDQYMELSPDNENVYQEFVADSNQ
jgi:hypothetical protein